MCSSLQKNDPSTTDADALRGWVDWALAELNMPVEQHPGGGFSIVPREDAAELPQFVVGKLFTIGTNRQHGEETLAWNSPLLGWINDRLTDSGHFFHARPALQPDGVAALGPVLMKPYMVCDGQVHLAGCSLEERPILRLTYRDDSSSAGPLHHYYLWTDGRLVDDRALASFRFDRLLPYPYRPKLSAEVLELLEQEVCGGKAELPRGVRPIFTTLLWCKYAEGKLEFVIGGRSRQLPFSGWAAQFADGSLLPPPLEGIDGELSYNIAADEQGTITTAESIGVCAISGRRVLVTELETCEETGKRALPEYMETCPVTGRRVVRLSMAVCPMCRQRVAPSTMQRDRCAACRSLHPIGKDDPLAAPIFGEYPNLDRYRRWTFAETSSAYILHTQTFWRRLIVVLGKASLEPLCVAWRGRFSKRWTDVPEVERRDLLG